MSDADQVTRFSDGERLIAFMLADLMEALKVKSEIDPAFVKSVIGGDEWALKRRHSGIFDYDGPSKAIVSETTNILWMFSIIESSIAKLTGDEAKEAEGWLYKSWHGFDGNNDRHYGVAQTMIETLGEFSESRKGVNLNSHSQTSLPRYRAMLDKFQAYVQAGAAAPLSMAALRDLCA